MKRTKLNRVIFYCLNAAALLSTLIGSVPFLFRDPTAIAVSSGVFLLGELILFFLFVKKPDGTSPAARDIPMLLFVDVIVYAAVLHIGLFIGDRLFFKRFYYPIYEYGIDVIDGTILAAVLISAVTGIMGLAMKKRTFKWISVLILGLWGIAGIPASMFFQFLLYVLFVCMWMASCIAAERLDGGSAARNNWLGGILTALFMLALLFDTGVAFYPSLVTGWSRVLNLVLRFLSTPWMSFTAALVLTLCALPMCSFDPWRVGIDAYALLTCACLVLVGSFAMQRLIAYSLVVLAAVVVLSIRQLGRYASGQSFSQTTPLKLALGGILIILLAYEGMWLTLLVLAACALILRVLKRKNPFYRERPLYWMLLPACSASLALTLLLYKRMSVPGVLTILLITAVTLAVMWVLARPHPAGIWGGNGYRTVVCSVFALLCALTLCRGGVSVSAGVDSYTVQAELTARERDATVDSGSYQWEDAFGNPQAESNRLPSGYNFFQLISGVKGTRLIIRATDSNGVTTRCVFWPPLDLNAILYS